MKFCAGCKKDNVDCPYPRDYKELLARHTGECRNFVPIDHVRKPITHP